MKGFLESGQDEKFDQTGSPPEKLQYKRGRKSLMHSPETNIINEVNEEDAAYGMPLTENASLPTMNQLSAGVNRKLDNIFNQGGQDFGLSSSRPMSTHSGVFGGPGGSHAASPNTSIVKEKLAFDSARTSKEKFDRFNSFQSSPKTNRRKETLRSE